MDIDGISIPNVWVSENALLYMKIRKDFFMPNVMDKRF